MQTLRGSRRPFICHTSLCSVFHFLYEKCNRGSFHYYSFESNLNADAPSWKEGRRIWPGSRVLALTCPASPTLSGDITACHVSITFLLMLCSAHSRYQRTQVSMARSYLSRSRVMHVVSRCMECYVKHPHCPMMHVVARRKKCVELR